MSWDFETDRDFEPVLERMDEFIREEVEPLDFVITTPFDLRDPVRAELIPPLQERVRERGLWACHLGPGLGGQGFGQVKLALKNELLGRAPVRRPCSAHRRPIPATARFSPTSAVPTRSAGGSSRLLANRIVSSFSMTEPQGGADPKVFRASGALDGDEWVNNGEKWFTSNARYAAILIVMVVTDPDTRRLRRLRALQRRTSSRRRTARPPWGAFVVAQTRLGGGRVHHAMRTVGLIRRSLDLMAERALSRTTQGQQLARMQLGQEMIADTWLDLETYRLLVLRTAWRIDKYQDYRKVRADISAVKALMPRVLRDAAARALQVHGSLGISNEMPFLDYVSRYVSRSFSVALADGPTEVHKVSLARGVRRGRSPSEGLFPSGHLPALRAAAIAKYTDVLQRHGRSG